MSDCEHERQYYQGRMLPCISCRPAEKLIVPVMEEELRFDRPAKFRRVEFIPMVRNGTLVVPWKWEMVND